MLNLCQHMPITPFVILRIKMAIFGCGWSRLFTNVVLRIQLKQDPIFLLFLIKQFLGFVMASVILNVNKYSLYQNVNVC